MPIRTDVRRQASERDRLGSTCLTAQLLTAWPVPAVLVGNHHPDQYDRRCQRDQRRYRGRDRDEQEQYDRQPRPMAVQPLDLAVAESDEAEQVDRQAT